MRLARFDAGSGPKVGVVIGKDLVDVSAAGFADMLSIVRGGKEALSRVAAASKGSTSVPL